MVFLPKMCDDHIDQKQMFLLKIGDKRKAGHLNFHILKMPHVR